MPNSLNTNTKNNHAPRTPTDKKKINPKKKKRTNDNRKTKQKYHTLMSKRLAPEHQCKYNTKLTKADPMEPSTKT